MSASVVANLTVQFGKSQLPLSQIFILRKNVFATTNLKPACPGHVLVASRRPVKRLHELTEVETLDLWTTVQQVSRVMEQIHKFPCQIGVQDGTDAGQTIDHVHIHIIPFPKEYSQDVIMDSEGRIKCNLNEENQIQKYYQIQKDLLEQQMIWPKKLTNIELTLNKGQTSSIDQIQIDQSIQLNSFINVNNIFLDDICSYVFRQCNQFILKYYALQKYDSANQYIDKQIDILCLKYMISKISIVDKHLHIIFYIKISLKLQQEGQLKVDRLFVCLFD
ncbi:scavenger mRNA decapping enzyme carboxy-term-binding protein (macronuclear) [Tetrahymena thermophila SB210]|uniref:Scavenger mRNA decapping enzyme carboxy-term-binding protein n=1 Tax=Tetrahymena thermophila (strain SB210) TaxID=312017 RepID=Q23FD8_TETTS|nr:scavenger mRNA decapping enzyme carboxy-term-binding protein [Tetrahymena thermophila SB210]EAR95215.4 scavenger mRNA decapping enzyme carboxy-term-binding protein [Tetrahymena thermophila SB210]|eukprot:XP_001015460.4 scavenger mRNA decapping enzyme carboxy-term-binding protein [Tetrahymena thermophila SB210]